MADFLLDLRLAWRGLVRHPSFAAIVVLTLGLAIGACTAIFGAVHALLLRPFPFEDPGRLVRVTTIKGGEEGPLSIPELDDLARLDSVEDVAGYTDQGLYNASGFGAPEELQATITTSNLFRVLGMPLARGSTWPSAYDRSRQFALVISHGLWVRRFARRPDIVGQTLTLDGSPGYVVHGVLPPGFNFPSHSDLFRSSGIAADPKTYERRDLRSRMALVRVKDGVTIERVRQEIDALGQRLAREFATTNAGMGFRVVPLRDLYVGHVRPYLLLMLAGVGLVLLVACSNVANLLLSRALSRDREVAVRVALGAGRVRIVRQLLTESVLLAVLGGVVGLLVAVAGIRVLNDLVAMPLPPWMRIELDGVVLIFLGTVALLTGVAAGAVPALRAGRDLRTTLNEGGRGASAGAGHATLRNALVVAEVALAFVLMVGASLLARSVARLQAVDPGFRASSLLTFRVELGWRAYDTHEKTVHFHSSVIERLAALPGVDAVALDTNLALSGKPREPGEITVDGQSANDREQSPFVHWHTVNPGFFGAMRIPIIVGRAFTDLDLPHTEPVVVVSERLASRLWPGRDPLGKRIGAGTGPRAAGQPEWLTVIGVAGNVQHQQIGGEPSLDVYRPYRQGSAGGGWYAIRTRQDPHALARDATAIVAAVDPNQSYFDVQTMGERIEGSIWQRRAAGSLFVAFAGVAVILAAVGLYGVLSFIVSQQWRELGVRVALGAQHRDIHRLVIGRGLRLTGVGLGVGLALGAALARAVSSLVFGLSPFDPLTFLIVPVTIALVAVAACYLPARRATAVDPIIALRSE
jgi:putative ABC transport system permease protein